MFLKLIRPSTKRLGCYGIAPPSSFLQPTSADSTEPHRTGDAPHPVPYRGPDASRPAAQGLFRVGAMPRPRGGRERRWELRWWAGFIDQHPQAAQLAHRICAFLPPLNFITIHYAYFIVVILVASAIFWASSDPAHSISYIDSLFLAVSAMTEAGLNTVNLSQMTTWQQVLLWLLILFGGAIWVSIWTVSFRLHAFERHFEDIVAIDRERRERERPPGSSLSHSVPFSRTPISWAAMSSLSSPPAVTGTGSKLEAEGGVPLNMAQENTCGQPAGRRRASSTDSAGKAREQMGAQKPRDAPPSPHSRITFADGPPAQGGGNARTTASVYAAHDAQVRRRNFDDSASRERHSIAEPPRLQAFLTSKTVGRNAQFHDLTAEEREQLGGCEYRALKVLSIVVPLYFVIWQILGCIALGAWIAYNKPEVTTSNGLNPWWTGIFFGVSAFNNSGMALLDANVVPFQSSFFVLVVMGAMILAGNTAYPILLRFIFWSMLKLVCWTTDEEVLGDFKETLRFILKYPRRVYTNMFPARQTWWLLFMVCLLNITDWVGFELLNLGNPTVEAIPVGSRIIDGLFQGIGMSRGSHPTCYKIIGSDLYSGPVGRVLSGSHIQSLHRIADPLCDHDVYIGVPSGDHDAPFKCLRGTQSRYLHRRLRTR